MDRSSSSDSNLSEDEQSPLEMYFNRAANHVRSITAKLTENQLLELYGLYKQSTEGPCTTPRPGFFNLAGKRKWDAWSTLGNMPADQAKLRYIDLVSHYDSSFQCDEPTTSKTSETWVTVSSLRHNEEPVLPTSEYTILDAARENCVDKVDEMLSRNSSLKDIKDDNGMSFLHWAADRDSVGALEVAIRHQCDLNSQDSSGQTPLHYAVSCGHLAATKALLGAGACTTIQDEDGLTPLDLANDNDIKKLLLQLVEPF